MLTQDKSGFALKVKRDWSRSPAAERKARQRRRERDSGMVRFEVCVSKETAADLQATADLTEGGMKEVAEMLIRLTATRHRKDMAELTLKAGELWAKARPFSSYVSFLTKPGTSFRVGSKTITYEEWEPICRALGEISTLLRRRGWSKARVDSFLSKAGMQYLESVKPA